MFSTVLYFTINFGICQNERNKQRTGLDYKNNFRQSFSSLASSEFFFLFLRQEPWGSLLANWFPDDHFWPDVFSSFDGQRSGLALELAPVASKHPIRIIDRRCININATKPFTDSSTACSTNGRSATSTILRVFLDAYRIEQSTDNDREHRSDS